MQSVKFVGLDTKVPLLDGRLVQYVNLDNAASTPAFQCVQDSVNNFLPYYSSVHRGNGFKSLLSTHYYDLAHEEVLQFVDADPNEYMCIFGKNTSDATMKLARTFPITPERNVVLISSMEHHSSDLPFRFSMPNVTIKHIDSNCDGTLNMSHLDELLQSYGKNLALVVITYASNVTGVINDVYTIARKTHQLGGQIYVDCAQIFAHRKVRMKRLSDPEHLDYIAFSAHKAYAPFGTGALVGRIDLFINTERPEAPGGGTVDLVTYEKVKWTTGSDREENGSPNTIGAVALLASLRQLQQIGFNNIARHEGELTVRALKGMKKIPGLEIIGLLKDFPVEQLTPELAIEMTIGAIPFEIVGMNSHLVSAILSHEHGIGIRTGCFCAHSYMSTLLQLPIPVMERMHQGIFRNDKTAAVSICRVSFGLANSEEDVDRLVCALEEIAKGNFRGKYALDIDTGHCFLQGMNLNFDEFIRIGPSTDQASEITQLKPISMDVSEYSYSYRVKYSVDSSYATAVSMSPPNFKFDTNNQIDVSDQELQQSLATSRSSRHSKRKILKLESGQGIKKFFQNRLHIFRV